MVSMRGPQSKGSSQSHTSLWPKLCTPQLFAPHGRLSVCPSRWSIPVCAFAGPPPEARCIFHLLGLGAHDCGILIAAVRSYHDIVDATSRCGNVYDIGFKLILLTPCCAMMLVAIAKHKYILGQVLEPVWHDQVC